LQPAVIHTLLYLMVSVDVTLCYKTVMDICEDEVSLRMLP
jgi:hypothetical protein